MRRGLLVLVGSALGLLAAASPMYAHHSWQLDRSKLVTLKGTVTKFDFANPHVQIYLQAKDDTGNTTNWTAGGPSPNQLHRSGWTQDTVKPGDEITVSGYRNRNGSYVLRFDTVTLASGQVLRGYAGFRR
jgi:Family of unknown function (DUF6152)